MATGAIGELVLKFSADIADILTGTQKVGKELQALSSSVSGSISTIKTTIGTLAGVFGVALGVDAFAGMITGAIKAQERLYDLAETVGVTASALSSLVPAARLSNTSLEEVAAATNKFSKNLVEIQAGTGKASEVFKTLGFSAADAGRFLKDPTQGLFELSKRLNEFATDGNKSAAVMLLMGKGAAQNLPFFKQLGEQLELTTRVTDEQAKAADNLLDEYELLKLRSDDLKNTIAAALVPEFSRLLQTFIDTSAGAQSFGSLVKSLADDGSLAIWVHELAIVLVTAAESFIVVGKALYAFAGSVTVVANDINVAAILIQVSQGNIAAALELKGALQKRESDLSEANSRWSKLWNDNSTVLSDALKRQLEDLEKTRIAFNKTLVAQAEAAKNFRSNADALDLRFAGKTRPSLDVDITAGDKASERLKEFSSALQRFRQSAAEANLQLTELLDGRKITAAQKAFETLKVSDVWKSFTAGQKQAIEGLAQTAVATQEQIDLLTRYKSVVDSLAASTDDFANDFQVKFSTLTEAFNAGIIKSLEEYQSLIQRLLSQQPFAKREADALREMIKLEQQVIVEMQRMQDVATQTLTIYADQNTRIEAEISLIGLSNTEREKALIVLDAQAERQKLINANDEEGLKILDELVARRQQLVDVRAQREGFVAGWQDVFRSLTDRAAQFIEDFVSNGSSAFKNLWEDFKRWALAALAKIAAQQIVVGLVGSLAPGLASAAGGGAGGIGSLLSSLFGGGGGLTSLFANFSSGFSSLSASIFGAAGELTSGLVTAGTGLAGFVQSTALALGASESLAVGLASAVPVVGWIAAAGILAYSIFGGKGGGPKSGGSATLGDVSALTTLGTGGAGLGRFFTPNTADKEVQDMVAGLGDSFKAALKSLGGQAIDFGFALGYDYDPEGTAQSRVSGGATVGGKQVFLQRDLNVGRSEEELKAGLSLEAQRVLLAALKSSDLPANISKLFSGIDVETATSEQITKIEQTAAIYAQINAAIASLPEEIQQRFTDMLDGSDALASGILLVVGIIKDFGSVVDGLGARFEVLDAASITAFVDALGGTEDAFNKVSFLFDNFVTSSQKLALATDTLNADFEKLGLSVPVSHQAFLDLLNSFDLTTEVGRAMYASVLDLAGLFVQVNGTAEQAAGGLDKVSGALSDIAKSAQDFFNENFFTAAEQAASKLADATKQVDDAQAALGISIPRTVDGFRSLIESIDRTTPAGQALYAALIVLAPAIFNLAGAAKDAAAAINAAATSIGVGLDVATSASEKFVAKFTKQIDDLANFSGGDLGAKLGLKIGLYGDEIVKLQTQLANRLGQTGGVFDIIAVQIQEEIASLSATNSDMVAKLAEFTTLKAQYGAQIAEQLIQLEEQYDAQRRALKNNVAALALLDEAFNRQWQEIINGVGGGVDGTLGQLEKLLQGIRDYIKQLTISDLSPLTPLQKLTEAQLQYNATLALAREGNLTALGDITKYSNALLVQGRAVNASSQAYTDLFNAVVSDLSQIANPPIPSIATAAAAVATTVLPPGFDTTVSDAGKTGGQNYLGPPVNTAITSLANAVPLTGRMISNEDALSLGLKLDKLNAEVVETRDAVIALNGAAEHRSNKHLAASDRSSQVIVTGLQRKSK